MLLLVEDLTGSPHASSRFPGFDYLLMTVPYGVHHVLAAWPKLQEFLPMSRGSCVWVCSLAVTAYASMKLAYIVSSMLSQTFAKLGRPSYFFNLDKRALR